MCDWFSCPAARFLHEQGDKVAREGGGARLSAGFVQQLALPPSVGLGVGDGDNVARGKAELVRVGRLVVVERLDVKEDRLACIAVLPRGGVTLRCGSRLRLPGRWRSSNRCALRRRRRRTRCASPLLLRLRVVLCLLRRRNNASSAGWASMADAVGCVLLLLLLLLQIVMHVCRSGRLLLCNGVMSTLLHGSRSTWMAVVSARTHRLRAQCWLLRWVRRLRSDGWRAGILRRLLREMSGNALTRGRRLVSRCVWGPDVPSVLLRSSCRCHLRDRLAHSRVHRRLRCMLSLVGVRALQWLTGCSAELAGNRGMGVMVRHLLLVAGMHYRSRAGRLLCLRCRHSHRRWLLLLLRWNTPCPAHVIDSHLVVSDRTGCI